MRDYTYGEKSVGLHIVREREPEEATKIRELYAKIIDLIYDMRAVSEGEKARLLSVAITEAQTAQMRAVKGITFNF